MPRHRQHLSQPGAAGQDRGYGRPSLRRKARVRHRRRVGRDPSEIRHSIQFGWDGKESNELLELSGRFLEQGVTEQVVYLRGEEPAKLAGKVAELLPELRRLQPIPS